MKRIAVELSDTFASYFANRVRQHTSDSYYGVPLLKFAEALHLYEHLLWSSNANCVIELGCLHGGSALWFRDRLETMAKYGNRSKGFHVFSIDRDISSAQKNISALDPSYQETITLLQGDVQSIQTAETLERLLPKNARCLVVEDTAHIYDTTFGALKNFSKFVPKDGFFVVEDGYLDTGLREQFSQAELTWDGRVFGGVLKAIED